MTDAERIEATKAKMAILNLTPQEVLQAVYRMSPGDMYTVVEGIVGFTAPPQCRPAVNTALNAATYNRRMELVRRIGDIEAELRNVRDIAVNQPMIV